MINVSGFHLYKILREFGFRDKSATEVASLWRKKDLGGILSYLRRK